MESAEASPAKKPAAFSVFKPKTAPPTEAAAPLDLFANRHARPVDDVDDQTYAQLAGREADALKRTVNLDVNAASASASVSAATVAAPEPEPIPVWDNEYGPYDDPNLLLVDILKQLAHDGFEQAKFDANARYPAMSYQKAAANIHGWHERITSGKKAVKDIDGVGKGIGEKIDRILKDKSYTNKEGKTYHPLGNIRPKQEEEMEKQRIKEEKEAEKQAAKEQKRLEREALKAEKAASKPASKRRKQAEFASDDDTKSPVKKEAAKVKEEKAAVKAEPGIKTEPGAKDVQVKLEHVKQESPSVKVKDEKPAVKAEPKETKSTPKKRAAATKAAAAKRKRRAVVSSDEDSEAEPSASEPSESEAESSFAESESDSDAPRKKKGKGAERKLKGRGRK
ncbi:hypothetical protein DFJ74DRAFT_706200 [Hyaloraphidium curvatum]|nr:hypothetical protein DFJ74DRAFT_706200 [Hyaloraphidium curvatum]